MIDPYLDIWASQAGYLLVNGSMQVQEFPPVTTDPVVAHENPPLTLVTGWKGASIEAGAPKSIPGWFPEGRLHPVKMVVLFDRSSASLDQTRRQ